MRLTKKTGHYIDKRRFGAYYSDAACRGMSQGEMARKFGCGLSNFKRILGRVHNGLLVAPGTVGRLARVFDLSDPDMLVLERIWGQKKTVQTAQERFPFANPKTFLQKFQDPLIEKPNKPPEETIDPDVVVIEEGGEDPNW